MFEGRKWNYCLLTSLYRNALHYAGGFGIIAGIIITPVGRDGSVGIATGYGLEGPGIESRWGSEIFRTFPDRPGFQPASYISGYRAFPGSKADGAWR